MAAAFSSVPPFQLSTPREKQVCDRRLRGGLVLQGRSSLVHRSATTIVRRKAPRHSSSPFVWRNEAAGDKITVTAGARLSSAEWEPGEDSEEEKATKSRRELLLLATAGTFSYASSPGLAHSAPVLDSDCDLEKCSFRDRDGGHVPGASFHFEEHLPVRVRRPAHILWGDAEYMRKYNEAYSRMKGLPDDDPRSFKNQWHVHHAFCNSAHAEAGSRTGLPLHYSKSCTFPPWQRMYLYFHERILGELIDDPSFALPFWNWDNQRPVGGNPIPLLLTQQVADPSREQLGDAIGNPRHFSPALVNLAHVNGTEQEILASNLSVLHRSVVSPTSPDLFLAGAYRANQTQWWSNSPGSWETDGHSNLQVGTGSGDNSHKSVSAGKLPMFCSHHSNVDRLWTVWRSLGVDEATRGGRRRRREIRDLDFINTRFSFYDHNKQLVSVRIKDALDTSKLRYTYETMGGDADWINFTARSSGAPKPSPSEFEPSPVAQILRKDESSTFLLPRREPSDEEIKAGEKQGLTPDDLEETLLVKGVKVPVDSFMSYWVFINLPDAGPNTPLDLIEFVGMITSFPLPPYMSDERVNFRLSIGAAVIGLKIPPLEPVTVTFVPRNQQEDAPFDGLETEWN